MARVGSSPVGLQLHYPRPYHIHFHQYKSLQLQKLNKTTKNLRIFCQINPDPTDPPPSKENLSTESNLNNDEKSVPATPSEAALPEIPTKQLNRRIALGTTLAAVSLFVGSRLDLGSISLKDLAVSSMPYEEALSNGKPTVVEFYADWCEVCRELAPDLYKVEQKYKDQVNFVMLNVDNTKWEQELDEFGVEGIPHFSFLDKKGNEEGNIVGRLPTQYFQDNVDSLVRGETSLPHARVVGQFSKAENRKVRNVVDPRSHG